MIKMWPFNDIIIEMPKDWKCQFEDDPDFRSLPDEEKYRKRELLYWLEQTNLILATARRRLYWGKILATIMAIPVIGMNIYSAIELKGVVMWVNAICVIILLISLVNLWRPEYISYLYSLIRRR